jgi:hypothetical protein
MRSMIITKMKVIIENEGVFKKNKKLNNSEVDLSVGRS